MASQNLSSPGFACIYSKTGLYIIPSFTLVWSFFLFPLSFLVVNIGFHRWRQNKRSTVSHADFFTFHFLAFNLVNFAGFVIYSVASLMSNYTLLVCAVGILVFAAPGLLSLDVLICLEFYVAVDHPVVYLSLKEQKWIWARHVLAFVIWLLCVLWTVLVFAVENKHIPILTLLGISASIISFCCLQVLRSLRNPGPGEGHRVSPSKRKAFFTMLAVLSVLVLYLQGGIVNIVVEETRVFPEEELCKFQKALCWTELPSSLMLSLLFLHRAGKLPKCPGKKNLRG